LKEGTVDETPKPAWITIPNNDGILYYTSNFKDNGAGIHTTNTPGESVSMAFKGTGFRWYADAGNPEDVSQIYIDGVLDKEVKLSDIAAGATNAIAYEKMDLSDGLHVVKIVNKSGNTIVRNMSFYSFEKTAIAIGPNMSAVRVYTEPANPMPGQNVKFHVVAKNIGVLPTPEGIVTGVAFLVNGGYVVCEDKISKSIAPGETIDLVANDFQNVGSVSKTFKLTAVIDDVSRYSDMDRSNNSMETTITVGQPDGMSLDSDAYTIALTKTHNTVLTATYKDENQNPIDYDATSYALYLSDNTDVAVVDSNGVVTAMSNGQANISVSYAGLKKKIAVVVGDPSVGVTGVSLDTKTKALFVNDTIQLNATVMPANATNKNIKWSSSNDTLAKVDISGKVTAISEGTAIITATTEDGSHVDTCTITVSKIAVTSITLNMTKMDFKKVFDTQKLVVTVNPSNATNKNIIWKSSDIKVAKVDKDGVVTPVGKGKATITAVSADNKNIKATCEVKVVATNKLNFLSSLLKLLGSLFKFF